MGRLLGVELRAPCEVTVLNRLAQQEPPKFKNRVKEFFKNTLPKKMELVF
jgi:hypothetical protein